MNFNDQKIVFTTRMRSVRHSKNMFHGNPVLTDALEGNDARKGS